ASQPLAASSRPLVESFGSRFEFVVLHKGYLRDGMAVLHSGDHTDGQEPRILLDGGIDRCAQCFLGLGHYISLRLGRREVFTAFNCLDLRHSPGLRIDENLRERAALHRIYGQLKLPVLHLELPGDWFTFGCARDQTLLQGYLHALERVRELGTLLLVVLTSPPETDTDQQHKQA